MIFLLFPLSPARAGTGIYSEGNDTTHPIDPAIYCDDPAFIGWATGWQNYYRSDGESNFSDPILALGQAVESSYDVVSLGDLNQTQIDNGDPVGEITMTFDVVIGNGTGFDFAVFENGFANNYCELAYVEVSSNGADFARFENSYFAAATEPVGGYAFIDATEIFYLAGKHKCGYGTRFDLDEIAGHPKVLDGTVDLNNINYVKIVDIPGSGDWSDSHGNPIFDSWVTHGSGGHDLDAIGVLNLRVATPTPTPSTTPSTTPIPTCTPPPPLEFLILESGDYDGNGTSDIAIFRDGSGLWVVRGVTRVYFGSASDIPVSGDYDGDGSTNIGIFRQDCGLWAIRNISRVYFGSSSDIPVPGDYDGDGCCNVGVFRGESSLWALQGVTRVYFGTANDLPAPGDYSGDGTKNVAVFRQSSGLWALRNISRLYFGSSGDTPIPGDYGGDGTWEVGIFRPASGLWAIRGVTRRYFGRGSDQPVPADYDGDFGDDIGIFRPVSGLWAVSKISRIYFGASGDIPVTR